MNNDMLKRAQKILGFFLIVSLATVPQGLDDAWGGDLYTVGGIEVTVTAQGTRDVRGEAFKQGRRKAFNFLMRRLVSKPLWDTLPVLQDAALYNVVQEVRVLEEKSSPSLYRAKLQIKFDIEGIRSLFADVALHESQSQPSLLLPILENNQGVHLWSQNNGWRDVWQDMDLDNTPTPFVVPSGDMGDAQLAPLLDLYDDAGNIRKAPLADLTRKYGVDTIVIARALDRGAGRPFEVEVEVISLEDHTNFTLLYRPRDEGGVLLQRLAAMDVLQELAERWKTATSRGNGERQKIRARVLFSTLDEWLVVSNTLAKARFLRDVTVTSLQTHEADITFLYDGAMEALQLAMAQLNLSYENALPQPFLQLEKTNMLLKEQ